MASVLIRARLRVGFEQFAEAERHRGEHRGGHAEWNSGPGRHGKFDQHRQRARQDAENSQQRPNQRLQLRGDDAMDQ